MITRNTATTRNTVRRVAVEIGAPLVAAGILIGGIVGGTSAIAAAQPGDTQCSTMSMTNGADQPTPNGMTRAGQIAAAQGPSASDGSMGASCAPASHG